MTTFTVHDLAYAKGTSEPVRQMLLHMQERIAKLEAQREWKELTMDEIDALVGEQSGWPVEMVGHVLICEAEAKLKDKNNGV